MSLTQFVHRVSKTANNNEEEVVEKDDEVNSAGAGPSLEAKLPVNKELTLEDLNEQISNNHRLVMNELACLKNKCISSENVAKGCSAFKKPKDDHDNFLLGRAKTFKDCLAACPEFTYVKESKIIYCTVCISAEDFEKLDDLSKNQGVIGYLGDDDGETDIELDNINDSETEKIKVTRILSNLKDKEAFG